MILTNDSYLRIGLPMSFNPVDLRVLNTKLQYSEATSKTDFILTACEQSGITLNIRYVHTYEPIINCRCNRCLQNCNGAFAIAFSAYTNERDILLQIIWTLAG